MSGFWSSETLRVKLRDLIEPFNYSHVQHAAYELGLGRQVYITGDNKQRTRRNLECGEQINIPPGQYALLLTEETIKMPADALGLVSMKSKHKFRGLISVSGFHIDPGYHGALLYAVYNAGPRDVPLTQGERVFQIWYAYLDQETDDTYKPRGSIRDDIRSDEVSGVQGDTLNPQSLGMRILALENQSASRAELKSYALKAGLGIAFTAVVSIFAAVLGLPL